MTKEVNDSQEKAIKSEEIQIQSTDVSLLSEEENKGIGYEIRTITN
ncbi:hypothetical protein [Butyrivibrio sp. NC3005]|nr:hypothetical protein [Butyrivibrio sp. NC3005]